MRTCGGCTLCCDGTLTVKVNEHKVFPNNPCPHLTDCGCGIYADLSRPAICDTYKCAWLNHEDIPEWMRPDKVGFLISEKSNFAVLTGDFKNKKIDGSALLYAINWCSKRDRTIFYTVPSSAGQDLYDRGNIRNHPDGIRKTGTMREIFEPIELFEHE